jgi:hypothetical protein
MGLSGMRWLLKRWWFWAGTGLVLVALLAGYLLIPEGHITQANCDRIQLGMTFQQVKSLLGNHYVPHGESFPGAPIVTWYEEIDFVDGNIIDVTFKADERDVRQYDVIQYHVIRKECRRTKLPFHELMKRRIERRIRALWP